MLVQCFVQVKVLESKKVVFECYQVKVNVELDCVIGWDKIKFELIKFYIINFIEFELKDLNVFYQLLLGKKVLEKMLCLIVEFV